MKNILTKEEFVSVMERMKAISDFEGELYKMYYRFSGDASAPVHPSLDSELIKVLNRMFYQSEEEWYTDIEYFIYELDYGRNWEPGKVTQDGEDIDISDAEKLYNYLMSQIEDIEK